MAMNKKERAEFDAAKKAAVVARALNWSEPVERDLFPKNDGNEIRGFTINTYSAEVLHALSSSIGHATSRYAPPKKTTTQRSMSMYSTELLAF